MSVVGIDIGEQTCYVAIAKKGGIEVVENEFGERSTLSCVAFGETRRFIGSSAENQMLTNAQNTIFGFKHLIGRKFKDLLLKDRISGILCDVVEGPSRSIQFKVNYRNETRLFSPQQIVAMILVKLKEVVESYLGVEVVDCVLSVPSFFNDMQRRSLLDSASIAGLNVLRLMNETSAAALTYGMHHTDLPAVGTSPRIVIFLDMGHSSLQLTACVFNKGQLKVLAVVANPDIGGSCIDRVLVQHFIEDIKRRYHLDARSNVRAHLRLFQECEQMKKLMSTYSRDIPLNIECLMNNKDVSGRMCCSTMEKLAENLFGQIEALMKEILEVSKLKLDDIHSVELIGGSSRIPKVRELVKKIFHKDASTTLNADEAVAIGCAFQCAMLTPKVKVSKFQLIDVQMYPINISRFTEDETKFKSVEIFSQFDPFPLMKTLTLYQEEPFHLDAGYRPADIRNSDLYIGRFSIDGVQPGQNNELSKVEVKVLVDIHGIVRVPSAKMAKNLTAMKAIDCQASENSSNCSNNFDTFIEVSAVMDDSPSSKNPNVQFIDLSIVEDVPHLTSEELQQMIELQENMASLDKYEQDLADAKNSLEEYIYEMREKFNGDLKQVFKKSERASYLQLLAQSEDWLFGIGSDKTKQEYEEHLKSLQLKLAACNVKAKKH